MMRSTGGSDQQSTASIDLAPMIDCVFLLLIFFIVTSVFVRDPGVEVERPDVSGETRSDRESLLIAVTSENRIYFDGQEIQLEHVASLLRRSAFDNETPVIIRADRRASHGTFALVFAEAKRSGLKHVLFATAREDAGGGGS